MEVEDDEFNDVVGKETPSEEKPDNTAITQNVTDLNLNESLEFDSLTEPSDAAEQSLQLIKT